MFESRVAWKEHTPWPSGSLYDGAGAGEGLAARMPTHVVA